MRIQTLKAEQPAAFSLWLDAFRWLAALVVLVAHAGGELLTSVSELPSAQRTLPHYLYSFIAGFSHHAVMVFFVLSGFLVGGSFCSGLAKGRVDIKSYLAKRITRLWIVLLPALLLTGLVAVVSVAIYQGDGFGVYKPQDLKSVTAPNAVCNAIFLQTVACPTFGGNGALWSLYNEFWYYIAFPFLALATFKVAPRIQNVVAAGVILAVILTLTYFQFRMSPLAPYLLIWLMGVVVAISPRGLFKLHPIWPALALAVALLVIRVAFGKLVTMDVSIGAFFADALIGLLFSALLLSFRDFVGLKGPPLGGFNKWAAGFSFSLYCTHIPVLIFYASVMMGVFGFGAKMVPNSVLDWGVVAGGLGLSIAFAYGFSLLTEVHTDRLRRWIFPDAQTPNVVMGGDRGGELVSSASSTDTK